MSLRQLQYIVAVVDRGSFRRAAEACHVSQPSLSAQVAVAERGLGVQLFERTGRRVRVPTAAAPLIAQARKVLIAAGDLRELAWEGADPFRGTLRVGIIPTICPYLLPDIARPLSRDFPDLTINWSEERTARLVRQIKDGAIDGAIVALEANLKGLAHAPLGWDPFLLAAAPGHALAQAKTRVTAAALDGESVLLLDDGHCFRDQAAGSWASGRSHRPAPAARWRSPGGAGRRSARRFSALPRRSGVPSPRRTHTRARDRHFAREMGSTRVAPGACCWTIRSGETHGDICARASRPDRSRDFDGARR